MRAAAPARAAWRPARSRAEPDARRSGPGRRGAAPKNASERRRTPTASRTICGSPVRKNSGTTDDDRGGAGQQRRVRAVAGEVLADRRARGRRGDASAKPQASSAPRRWPSLTKPERRSARSPIEDAELDERERRPRRLRRLGHPARGASAARRAAAPAARAAAAGARRRRARSRRACGCGVPWARNATARGWQAGGNGQPEESLTCHQPMSIPSSPRRGRTCQTPQPALAELGAGDALEAVAAGLEQHPLEQHAGRGLARSPRRRSSARAAARRSASSSRSALELAEVEHARAAASPARAGARGGPRRRRAGRRSARPRAGARGAAIWRAQLRAARRRSSAARRRPASAARREDADVEVGHRARSLRLASALDATPTAPPRRGSAARPRRARRRRAARRVSGAGPWPSATLAEEHRDRPPGVGDDEPPGGQVVARARPSPSRSPAPRGRAAPSGPSSASASSAQSGTPVSSAPTSSASSTRPARRKPAVHQPLDDDRLDRRAVDVGVEADVAEEHAVGGGHGLAAHAPPPARRDSGRRAGAQALADAAGGCAPPAGARRVDPGEPELRAARARPRRSTQPVVDGVALIARRPPAARRGRRARARRAARRARARSSSPSVVAVTRPPGRAKVSCGQTATP